MRKSILAAMFVLASPALAATTDQAIADLQNQTAGWVNVRSYGAVGDATFDGADWVGTDDTAAIQSAISAAVAGRKQLLLPDGTFRVTATLVVSGAAGFTMRGAGIGASHLAPGGALGGKPVLRVVNTRDSKWSDFTIEGNLGAPPSAGIEVRKELGGGPTSTNDTFERLQIGSVFVGLVDGIVTTCNPAVDQDNDAHTLRDVFFVNLSRAAFHVTHLNSLWHRVYGGVILNVPIGVKIDAGSAAIDGTTFITTDVDLEVGNAGLGALGYHPVFVSNAVSEVASATPTSPGVLRVGGDARAQVFISNYNRTGGATALRNQIEWSGPQGLLRITNSRLEFGQANQRLWVTGAGTSVGIVNSILGFDTFRHDGPMISVGNTWTWGGAISETHNGDFFQLGDSHTAATPQWRPANARGGNTSLSSLPGRTARNLRGTAVFGASDRTKHVDFTALGGAESSADYFVVLGPRVAAGRPSAGALRASSAAHAATGFDIALEAAPGSGNGVRVDWMIIQ